jgi:HEAT repeat protein
VAAPNAGRVGRPIDAYAAEFREISLILKRVPKRRPAYQIATALLRDGRFSLPEIEPLRRALRNPSANRWRERQAAAWALGHLELNAEQQADAAETLVAVLANRLPEDTARLGRSCLRTFLASCVLCTVWRLSFVEAPLSLLLFMSCLLCAGPCIPASLLLDDRRVNRVRAFAATALGRLQLPETTAPMAAALHDDSLVVREAASETLPAVLRTLTPDYYGWLGAQAVPDLCRALNRWNLRLPILEALEKVGDGRAVKPAERLLAEDPALEIQETLQRALPILQERKKREQESSMLLRGASSPQAAPDQLLRPAEANATTTAPEQLLRPSE